MVSIQMALALVLMALVVGMLAQVSKWWLLLELGVRAAQSMVVEDWWL
jgi:hypothetical protein